jgi:tetratricopeptide (TPR) repeat protein
MKRKTLLLVVAVIAVLAGACWWATRPPAREWSSSDREAIAAFREGMRLQEKVYNLEAAESFRAALEHDPEFVAARLMLASSLSSLGQKEEAQAETKRALEADPAKLKGQELVMWEIARLNAEKRSDEVPAALERFAKEYPNDAYITRSLASHYAHRRQGDEAIKWYERTLKLAPNDGLSYNMLGYIEMTRGNFAAAETNLRRYAFIAPDQANPHDSLGELYTLVGRWDDAERELHKALEINPRFVAAYQHLARLAALRGDGEAAERFVVQAVEVGGMPKGDLAGLRAAVHGWAALSRGDTAALRQAVTDPAVTGRDLDLALLRVIAAARSGDAVGARAVWQANLEAWPGVVEKGSGPVRAMFDLMEAVVLLAEGRAGAAVDATTRADDRLTYNADGGEGILKLTVRLYEVEALAASGRADEARRLLGEVEAVNPAFPAAIAARTVLGNA